MERVTHYYECLLETIDLQKYLTYNSLLTSRASEQKYLRELKDDVKNTILEIQDMMNDIQNNLDAVEGVDNSIYVSIMNGYSEKLQPVPILINTDVKSPE